MTRVGVANFRHVYNNTIVNKRGKILKCKAFNFDPPFTICDSINLNFS